jgi:hypothetical protein
LTIEIFVHCKYNLFSKCFKIGVFYISQYQSQKGYALFAMYLKMNTRLNDLGHSLRRIERYSEVYSQVENLQLFGTRKTLKFPNSYAKYTQVCV